MFISVKTYQVQQVITRIDFHNLDSLDLILKQKIRKFRMYIAWDYYYFFNNLCVCMVGGVYSQLMIVHWLGTGRSYEVDMNG